MSHDHQNKDLYTQGINKTSVNYTPDPAGYSSLLCINKSHRLKNYWFLYILG